MQMEWYLSVSADVTASAVSSCVLPQQPCVGDIGCRRQVLQQTNAGNMHHRTSFWLCVAGLPKGSVCGCEGRVHGHQPGAHKEL